LQARLSRVELSKFQKVRDNHVTRDTADNSDLAALAGPQSFITTSCIVEQKLTLPTRSYTNVKSHILARTILYLSSSLLASFIHQEVLRDSEPAMAVIPIFDPIEVEILVNNQPVTEYPDPDTLDVDGDSGCPAKLHVTKYIEAKTGATFTVRYKISPTFRLFHGNVDLVFSVHVDNKWMDAHAIERKYMNSDYIESITGHKYTKNGQWFERSFTFDQLNIGKPFFKLEKVDGMSNL